MGYGESILQSHFRPSGNLNCNCFQTFCALVLLQEQITGQDPELREASSLLAPPRFRGLLAAGSGKCFPACQRRSPSSRVVCRRRGRVPRSPKLGRSEAEGIWDDEEAGCSPSDGGRDPGIQRPVGRPGDGKRAGSQCATTKAVFGHDSEATGRRHPRLSRARTTAG